MKRVLQAAAAVACGVLVVGALVAAPMAIRSDGLGFPDGTVQTTAAAAAVATYSQHCSHGGILEASETLQLTCFSHHPGDVTWSDGVPSGQYFVVTDVLLDPATSTIDTGDVGFTLLHSFACDATPGNRLSRTFRVVPDLQTTVWSFRAPTMLLVAGDCLRVAGDSGITVPITVSVTGFLTASPELLAP